MQIFAKSKIFNPFTDFQSEIVKINHYENMPIQI